jgi:transcriptional regulator with XRE-family HTH domain
MASDEASTDLTSLRGRLRYARGLAELTGRELDALAGITKGHSSVIEYRDSSVSAEVALKLARALGVDPAWLIDGSGPLPKKRSVTMAVRRLKSTGTDGEG